MDKVIDKSSIVADTIHGQILISSFEKSVIATTLFNRLHGVHQNSTAYLTFPANRTKRVEHSFGTMYLCGNIFSSSICNASDSVRESFFKKAEEEIATIMKGIQQNPEYSSKLGHLVRKASTNYPKMQICGGLYNSVLPSNVKEDERKVFTILFESIRIAALLHDVGHPPFSHITEFALNNVYKQVVASQKENDRIKEFKEIVEPFFAGKETELHEQMGIRIARTLFKEAIKDITEEQAKEKDNKKYNRQLFQLIVAEIVINILKETSIFFKDLHCIIDGTLDGDRLDYVSRDPINSGFSVGVIEYERLISSMKLVQKEEHFLFCPSTSVINTIEDFLMRRWNLYRNIIYHHRVIKTDYLLQKSIEKLAIDYLMKDEKQEDSEIYILPYDISGLWKALRQQASALEEGYSISQWDDVWLLTILKKEYFENTINETTILNKMLTELLTNKKRFASLIKRKEEFGVIDKAVAKGIVEGAKEITALIARLRENQSSLGKENIFDIDAFLGDVEKLFEKAEKYSKNGTLTEAQGFLLFDIKTLLMINKRDILQEAITKAVEKYHGESYMVVFKDPKKGTSKDLYICKKYYEKEEEQFETLKGISDIDVVLSSNLKFSPFFFIYADMEMVRDTKFDFTKERVNIGKAIATEVCNCIKEIFQPYFEETIV